MFVCEGRGGGDDFWGGHRAGQGLWDGILPSQRHPSFPGNLFIGTSCSGLGARNLSPDFSPAIAKQTS